MKMTSRKTGTQGTSYSASAPGEAMKPRHTARSRSASIR